MLAACANAAVFEGLNDRFATANPATPDGQRRRKHAWNLFEKTSFPRVVRDVRL
jgi:hypothetical protein